MKVQKVLDPSIPKCMSFGLSEKKREAKEKEMMRVRMIMVVVKNAPVPLTWDDYRTGIGKEEFFCWRPGYLEDIKNRSRRQEMRWFYQEAAVGIMEDFKSSSYYPSY